MVDAMIRYRVLQDLEALSRAAAAEVVRLARRAAAARGRFTMALSGGRTPERLYRLLAGEYRDAVPWEAVHLYWGDERYLPPDHAESNYRMAREALLAHVPVPPEQVHPMPTSLPDPDEAARCYEEELRRMLAPDGSGLDLALLGMGVDGHTASLFPGTPAVAEQVRWVVPVRAPVEPFLRLTLTRPVLEKAGRLLFLVAGADKRPVWQAIQAGHEEAARRYPACLVGSAAGAVWLLDQAAFGQD